MQRRSDLTSAAARWCHASLLFLSVVDNSIRHGKSCEGVLPSCRRGTLGTAKCSAHFLRHSRVTACWSTSAVITFPPVAMLREHSLSVLVLAIGQPYCEDCVVTRLHSSSHCRGLVSVTLKAKPRHGQDGIICSPPTPQRQKLQGAFIRAKTLRTVRFPL